MSFFTALVTSKIAASAMANQSGDEAQRANYRYSDFDFLMSLADFTAYISSDDDEADGRLSISDGYEAAA